MTTLIINKLDTKKINKNKHYIINSFIKGTSSCLLVWSLEFKSFELKISSGFSTAVLLHSPYVLRVGTSPCIEVCRVIEGIFRMERLTHRVYRIEASLQSEMVD